MRSDLEFLRKEVIERIESLKGSEIHFKTLGNEQARVNCHNRRDELERQLTVIDGLLR